MKAKIIATSSYLPKKILSNADLEKIVETTDEWITSRTGMKERRIAAEGEYTSDMGIKAAQSALEKAGLSATDVDLIIVATLTPDYTFPSTACLIQNAIQATHAAALDVQAACSGFIYGLSIAKAYIESGTYRNILLIASEKLSSIVNYEDRATCILFGDGAAAALISSEGKGLLIDHVVLGADGSLTEILKMPGGGSRYPATQETVDQKMHYIHMEGRETFKHAVRRMEAASVECVDKAGIDEVHWMVPHQANVRIIEAIAKRFKLPMERVYLTIHKYGNTSASSIGIALDELLGENKISSGENILLTAFGAGLTWGSAVLTQQS
ncbi:MAG: ketoacyl-ACP synthase III [Simkaniaceae bacterium]|nr:ketoacyl-ACP synthase III [Simkaniaceae bacterium]MCF7852338.1 ketoacyl-ACP synthase III [Simkaniaceae bacterium]